MKSWHWHIPALALAMFAVACGGDTGQEDADMAAESAMTEGMSDTMAADEAAIDQFRMDYVQHYNLHHPDMVAAMFDDSATWLNADGSVLEGRAAIQERLTADMAGNPTVDITSTDTKILGDWAMSIGAYSVDTTPPEGQMMTMTGNYISGFEKQDGQFKLVGLITNFNTTPPEGVEWAEPSGEAPPENGTMTDLITAYETHFNLGHADMVADLFTDDAIVGFANLPMGQGRAAVVDALQQRFAMGDSPQIDIHDVYTMDFGDGWAVDAGWYAITTTGGAGQTGNYISLAQQQPDGTWKMHWMVSNGRPTM